MDTTTLETPRRRSNSNQSLTVEGEAAAVDPSSPVSMLVNRHGVHTPSPPRRTYTQTAASASKRAALLSKRKVARWMRIQHLEAKLAQAVAEKDLEKQLHERTKVQMQRAVTQERIRVVRAERAAVAARRRIAELEAVREKRRVREMMGEMALEILGLQAVDFVAQVILGYVGAKVMKVVDAQIRRGMRALIRR